MNISIRTLYAGTAALLVALLTAAPLAAQDEHAGHHGHHGHGSGAVPEMDAEGRRMDPAAADHDMSQEQLEALRAKIALYRAFTDAEVRMNMALMGPDYEWYVSDRDMQGDIGVLVLSHGVGENSDKQFVEALKPMAEKWPTAVSFGMAMMMSGHIQSSVDDLTDRGVETIVLVPTATSEYNSLTRQWRYIFGMREESTYLDVPRVETDARLIMADHINDHPLITDVLEEYILAESRNQANEVVIIVGHGPEDVEDNGPDLALLQPHADRIKARNDFVDVKVINLQDDAYPPIRKANVQTLRRWITSAQRAGHDVIVSVAASASYGVQQHVIEDLRGLDYAFADRGLAQHPNYLKWIQTTVEEKLAEDQQRLASADDD